MDLIVSCRFGPSHNFSSELTSDPGGVLCGAGTPDGLTTVRTDHAKAAETRLCVAALALPVPDRHIMPAMWVEPYLETCCRAALHRLYLCGSQGRPSGAADDPCLQRLMRMSLCRHCSAGRIVLTPPGYERHAREVLKKPNLTSQTMPAP